MILGVLALGLVLWQQLQAPKAAPEPPRSGTVSQQARLPPRRVLDQMRILDQHGEVLYRGRVDLQATLERIAAGGHYPHRNDGAVFQNRPPPGEREPLLPRQAQGYYREYVHPTPGESGPGPQRVVVGRGGEYYYTPDHYQTFIPLQ